MKIGIDIDGVILNSENEIRLKAELYDLLILHKNGVVNKNGFLDEERYDWTKEELNEFRQNNHVQLTKECEFMPGAKEIIKLLHKEGHELIIVTARGITIKEMRNVAEEKLKEHNLYFDKYYWATENKLKVCEKERIDVMIDDRASTCKNLAQNKIKTLYFRDVNREKLEENEYLKEVNNWGEIYRYIYNLNMEEE